MKSGQSQACYRPTSTRRQRQTTPSQNGPTYPTEQRTQHRQHRNKQAAPTLAEQKPLGLKTQTAGVLGCSPRSPNSPPMVSFLLSLTSTTPSDT